MAFPPSPSVRRPRALAAVACCLLAAAGTGCAVHRVDPDPRPAVAGAAGGAGEPGFAHGSGRAARSSPRADRLWWRAVGERDLDKLIAEALAGNPDLRAVGRRIDQANARLSQAGAALFPAADGTGEIRSRWDSGADRSDAASLGLLLDWEADVWGRLRSGKAARAQEAAAAFEDWRAARLLLTGAVAETWFELIEQRGQLRLAGEQIEVNRTLLELTRLRFGQGQSSVVAVLQQQEQLESTESRVPDIESRIAELELVLDTLAGRMPGGRKRGAGGSDLPVPPAAPAEGFPSDLLAERPDLRARRARIIALDHEVGEAIADRLPRFSVGGSAFADGAPGLDRVVAEAVAGVVGPIFDAGARKAEVARRRARVAEEIDLYTAEFLAAVREVETALVREGKLAERARRQEAQLGTARRLLEESRNRYRQGVTDYLPVLDAVSTFQELERDVLTSRRERLSARVALHRALGGPMPMPEPPESGMNPESGAGH